MTHYDPRDWGHEDPEPPGMGWPDVVLAVLFVILAAAMLGSCNAEAAPPYEVRLPDGERIEACTASYDATAKSFSFGPCNTVFADSFEGWYTNER